MTRPEWLTLALLLSACGSPGRQEVAPMSCAPIEGAAMPIPWEELPGTYQLTLVATTGAAAGNATTGILELWRTADDTTYVAYRDSIDADPETRRRRAQNVVRLDLYRAPLYGATTVAVAAVGGRAQQDPRARALPSPGVTMWDSRLYRITRFAIGMPFQAAHANYTGLILYRRTADGVLIGRWETMLYGGLGENPDAGAGYFCAHPHPTEESRAPAP